MRAAHTQNKSHLSPNFWWLQMQRSTTKLSRYPCSALIDQKRSRISQLIENMWNYHGPGEEYTYGTTEDQQYHPVTLRLCIYVSRCSKHLSDTWYAVLVP